ncbi:hypothetical protein DENSPDRAFT_884607 [Dentipellis sp. KUC8613]|nr:hypothetical protein DENSPDRAFT_884607 [Dentipellis sp. KUC8613]
MRDRELSESAGNVQSTVQLVFQVQYDTDEIDSLRNYGRGHEAGRRGFGEWYNEV